MDFLALNASGSTPASPGPKPAYVRILIYGSPQAGTGTLVDLAGKMEVKVEAAFQPIYVEQGSQYSVPFKWYGPDQETPVDLTNKALELIIVQNKNDSTPIYKIGSPTNLTKDANGNIIPIISAVVTSTFAFGRGFYELSSVNYTGSAIVTGGAYTLANIDVDDGNSRATITADGGTPYSGLAAGDLIQVSGLTDSDNDGVYEIYSVTNTVITTTLIMNGSDVSSQAAISIQPLNEGTRKRLAEGPVILTAEAN